MEPDLIKKNSLRKFKEARKTETNTIIVIILLSDVSMLHDTITYTKCYQSDEYCIQCCYTTLICYKTILFEFNLL